MANTAEFDYVVSISLSSGFSFQGFRRPGAERDGCCFNLVIERLLISGRGRCSVKSSGLLSFQSRYRAASHFREIAEESVRGVYLAGFNLVIERLLISGFILPKGTSCISIRFNLVIERLLISGALLRAVVGSSPVSISLSSGFSFQDFVGEAKY